MTYRARMHPDQIALQLWTVRALTAVDVPGTLKAVRAAGYGAVELARIPPESYGALRGWLDDAELQPMGAHEVIEDLRADAASVAARLTAVGCPRVIVSWMPEADRLTHSDVRRFAAELARFEAFFADHGIALGYHNHWFEFDPLDGTTAWDILLAELPATIELEIDVYWTAFAGRDPVAEIVGAGERVRLLHMKDRSMGEEPHDVPAGEGTLDMPAIVAAGRVAGVDWYVAEQDEPEVILDDIASAYRYLSSIAS
jgi:sugar phosphate isomerase/epimerase